MKKLSYWASQHKRLSWLCIAACYVVLNACGILLAVFLFDDRAKGASSCIALFLLLCVAALVLYPTERTGGNYWKRKGCDGMLVLATLLFVVGNTANQLKRQNVHSFFGQSATAAWRIPMHEKRQESSLHERLHDVRDKYKELSTGEKIAMVVVVLLGAVAAGYLLAMIACSLSCGGNEALAVIVAIVGLAGILAGAFFLIRRIFRRQSWLDKRKAQRMSHQRAKLQ